jgi:hypothetical protein
MAKTNLKSDWDSSGNLVFTANASGSGSMVFNTNTPTVLGCGPYAYANVTNLTTATNYTMTVAQLLGGYTQDVPTVNCTAVLPTVAQVVAVIPGYLVGTTFNHIYRCVPGSAQAIAIQTDASSQWTAIGNVSVNTNVCKTFEFMITAANTGVYFASAAVSAT